MSETIYIDESGAPIEAPHDRFGEPSGAFGLVVGTTIMMVTFRARRLVLAMASTEEGPV